MKFQKIIISLLSIILLINTVAAVLLINEEKKQTKIQLTTAELNIAQIYNKFGIVGESRMIEEIDRAQKTYNETK